MFYILAITVLVYLGVIIFTRKRIAITLIGSGVLLMVGAVTNLFDVSEAFRGFPSEILVLIIVLTLFTSTFEKLGFINYIGYEFLRFTKKKKVLILVSMCLLVYMVSLFMNNLTVVLFFSSIALYMVLEFNLPVIPLLVGIIIGSNIGGAPLPWADTPAVVLTLYSDFTLVDFLNKLFVPCLCYAIGLSYYTYWWYKKSGPKKRESPFAQKPDINWRKLGKFLVLFVLYIIGISIGPFINISIAYISLFFGGILLCMRKQDEMLILNALPIMDSLMFFITLFLIGSVLQCSGVLSSASEYLIGLAGDNMYFMTLVILGVAFLTSTFLSAGPAAATLLPVCKVLALVVPCKLIYAALSLGILAGSSMLPWSATGGPVMLSQTKDFLEKRIHGPRAKKIGYDPEKVNEIQEIFLLKAYLKFSVPYAMAMLFASAVYLVVYIRVVS